MEGVAGNETNVGLSSKTPEGGFTFPRPASDKGTGTTKSFFRGCEAEG